MAMNDWAAVAALMLERSNEPSIVLSADGSVTAMNAAMERLLGWTRLELLGKRLVDLSTTAEHTDGTYAVLEDAMRGVARHFELPVVLRSGARQILYVSADRVGDRRNPDTDCLVVTVLATRPAEPSSRSALADDRYYEVSRRDGDTGRLTLVRTPGYGLDLHTGTLCHETFYGRDAPCDGCPAFASAEFGAVKTGIVLPPGDENAYALVTAVFTSDETVCVTMRLIGDAQVTALVHAKLDRLARVAGLSVRERNVFDLLLLGRPPDRIAEHLGIARRTVKFHQSNVLHKLGVDSRVELLRLLS